MKKILVSLVASSYLLFGAYNSPGTDYDKAVTESYTNESALEGLNTINMILGFIHDSKADHFINKGPYKAMMTHDEDGGASSSTSSKVQKLWPMTLNVTRDTPTTTNPNPPMKIQFWLDVTEDRDFRMRVIGFINVTHGEDNLYPLGEFRMDAVAYGINSDNTTNTNQEVMKTVLNVTKSSAEDGKAFIKYYEEFLEDDGNWRKSTINMVHDPKNKNGVVFSRAYNYELNQPQAYDLTFDNGKYKLQLLDTSSYKTDTNGNNIGYEESGTSKCKSKTEFRKKIYRYGLFDSSNGKKVAINSGFPIVKDNSGVKYHGYIGYWGLWSEGNEINDGDIVKRDDIDNSPNYTIHQTKGKLIKHTKETTTLSKLAGTKLTYWTNLQNNPNIFGEFVLHWDKNNQNFIVDGVENCNENGCETNTTVANGVLGSSDANLSIGNWTTFWSESLNSEIPYISNATNDTQISYHKRETVIPTSDLTLVNFGHEVINPDMNMSDLSNYPEAIEDNGTNNIIGKQYTFDATNQVLKDGTKEIVFPSDANFSDPGITHRWWSNGADMGPLLTSNVAADYNQSNYWQAQNEDTYYTWETGQKSWNKTTYIENNGQIIHFDPPMVLTYIHKTENDANGDATNDGKLFTLRYDGQSLGLPWKYVQGKGWMPQINIKSGTKVGDSEQYVIKALSMGLVPKELTDSECNTIQTNHNFDVDTNFISIDKTIDDSNQSLVELNSSIVGDTNNGALVGTTLPDANVTVVKGKLIQR